MNILVFCPFPEGFGERFQNKLAEAVPDAHIVYADREKQGEARIRMLEAADVTVGYFDPNDMKYLKNVKLMQFDIEGVDAYIHHPDLPENVIVCNAGGNYNNIVAEHAVSLVYALCRDLHLYAENKLQHRWYRVIPDKTVEDSTIMILGAGAIGTTAATLLRPLAKKIIGVRRTAGEAHAPYDEMIGLCEVDEKLPETDILICALPGTEETKGFLAKEKMRKLREDAVIVNVGRGSLIPTADLLEVLKEGKLRGIGLDVMETEPLPEDSPLWDCEKLILTPHAAGNAMAQDSPTYLRITDLICENLKAYSEGRPLKARVSRKTGYREK